jgi:hypothetical protein
MHENFRCEGSIKRPQLLRSFSTMVNSRVACASSEMNMHRFPMRDRTLLTSGPAGGDTVVKTGEE